MTNDLPLDVTPIRRVIIDHALASGLFDAVGGHEPKRAPGTGLTAAVWVQTLDTVQSSGLASTTARLVFQGRIYTSMTREPQDDIDPVMTNAAAAWIGALVGDLKLKGPDPEPGAVGLIRTIDVRGSNGIPLTGQAGYIEQDGKLFRVYTITVPCLVNDVWEEAQ